MGAMCPVEVLFVRLPAVLEGKGLGCGHVQDVLMQLSETHVDDRE